MKHAENRLLAELPEAERSKILRMKTEPQPDEIHEVRIFDFPRYLVRPRTCWRITRTFCDVSFNVECVLCCVTLLHRRERVKTA